MKKQNILFSAFICFLLGACSVHKAAENDGVDPLDIKYCKTKSCLLAKGMNPVSSKHQKDDTVVETYKAPARKSGLNYARAVGHGVLDVCTLGLWEIIGTPVEGAISNNRRFIVVQATYASPDSETIEKMEICDSDGHKIQ